MSTKTLVVSVIAFAVLFAIVVGVGVGVHHRHERENRSNGISRNTNDQGLNETALCTFNISSTGNFDSSLLSNASAAFATNKLTFQGSAGYTIFAPDNTAFTNLKTQVPGVNVTQALLAYHVIPGVYDNTSISQLAPNAPDANPVATELGAVVKPAPSVNFTSIVNETIRVTDDFGVPANATYVGHGVDTNEPRCQWALYRTTTFLAPKVLRNDTDGAEIKAVADALQQGPIVSLPAPLQSPSES